MKQAANLGFISRQPTIAIVRGPVGSGKSTFAESLCDRFGFVKFENDDFFVDPKTGEYRWFSHLIPKAIAHCYGRASEALVNGRDVVVSNTFYKVEHMDMYMYLANTIGARFIVFRCTGMFNNVHGVPPEKVEWFRNNIEPYDEEIVLDKNGMLNTGTSLKNVDSWL